MLKHIALLAAFSFSSGAHGLSQGDRDIGELFDRSSEVVEGVVELVSADCNSDRCRSAVRIRVTDTYKGSGKDGDLISFCGIAPLQAGFRYLVFVESADEHKGCPGVVESDAVFTRFEDKAYRYMSPGSFELVHIEGREYLTGWKLEPELDRVLVANDDKVRNAPTYDAALGVAVRAMAAESPTCALDGDYRGDEDIVGTLYAGNYIIHEARKKKARSKDVYDYVVQADGHPKMQVTIAISNGACVRVSITKNVGSLTSRPRGG